MSDDDSGVAEVDRLIAEVSAEIESNPYQFDRRFLFRTLAMGHSQFAEIIGARGPNTQVNAACASTTQAISIAEDWIRSGRAKRVVIVSADDATGPHLLPWVTAGFLATGAAATDERVEDAATPFDRRRHGMIVGMGAAAFVVESAESARERGLSPIAEVLGAITANSFHGTRLDIEHIGGVMESLLVQAERRGIKRHEIAGDAVHVARDLYPGPRWQCAAEINALRQVFGEHAGKVVITNTRLHRSRDGCRDRGRRRDQGPQTGIVRRCRTTRPDPTSVNSTSRSATSTTATTRCGSRPASAHRSRWRCSGALPCPVVPDAPPTNSATPTGSSTDTPGSTGWTGCPVTRTAPSRSITAGCGSPTPGRPPCRSPRSPTSRSPTRASPERRRCSARPHRSLPPSTTRSRSTRRRNSRPPRHLPPRPLRWRPHSEPVMAASEPVATPAPSTDAVLERVTDIVAEMTGYPADLLDPELDLEADLGVDTVKQAEVFAAVREEYGVERDATLQLRDFPTLNHVAGWIRDKTGIPAPTAAPAAPAVPAEAAAPAPTAAPAGDAVLAKVTDIVAEMTGYPADLLDPDLDLEADLGVDTVKQAEVFAAVREEYGVERDATLQARLPHPEPRRRLDPRQVGHGSGSPGGRGRRARPHQPRSTGRDDVGDHRRPGCDHDLPRRMFPRSPP